MKKIIIAILAIIILIGVGAVFYLNGLGDAMDSSGEQAESVNVTIEPGMGTSQIAQRLVDNGIIASANEYKIWSRLKKYDSKYQAGTYSLTSAMTFDEIAEIIVGGKVNTHNFTIPEGYTIYQVADKLSSDGLVDKDAFLEILKSNDFDETYDFLQNAQKNENHLEGYLFPNTYNIPQGASEREIIEVMLNQYSKEVTSEDYSKAEAMGYSMNEILIIASIIEREAVLDEERPLVASVIYNRLEKGMALQMCSTVQYILGEQKAVLTYADIAIDSPYNTYKNQGLPPGPICSPGKASIDAALNPADTDYLYFVLSEKLDGTSNFSSDYSKFEKDKAAYDKAYTKAHS